MLYNTINSIDLSKYIFTAYFKSFANVKLFKYFSNLLNME